MTAQKNTSQTSITNIGVWLLGLSYFQFVSSVFRVTLTKWKHQLSTHKCYTRKKNQKSKVPSAEVLEISRGVRNVLKNAQATERKREREKKSPRDEERLIDLAHFTGRVEMLRCSKCKRLRCFKAAPVGRCFAAWCFPKETVRFKYVLTSRVNANPRRKWICPVMTGAADAVTLLAFQGTHMLTDLLSPYA